MEEARRLFPEFDMTRSWSLPDIPAQPQESWGDYLRRIGFSDEQLYYTRRSFSNALGDSMFLTSAQAVLEDLADKSAGEGDFRILDGYDCLAAGLAEALDIRLQTIVEAVAWSAAGVRVQMSGGVFEADNAVITLPLGVLQAGTVRFAPELPAEKQQALAKLHMGPVLKLVYRFEEPILPSGVMALYSALNPPMWWSPSFGHETDAVVVTAFVSGDWARELLALGEAGALAKGLDTLRTELGRPDLQAADARLVNWPADPFALGGYSVATPGHADARAMLAAPAANRLFWAGEATAPNSDAATVHGAYASGQRAAAEILRLM
jgi:monoamine oxidase